MGQQRRVRGRDKRPGGSGARGKPEPRTHRQRFQAPDRIEGSFSYGLRYGLRYCRHWPFFSRNQVPGGALRMIWGA